MTDQEREIKRVISYIRSCSEAGIDTTITIDKSRNHLVLNALEEIEQYRAMEKRLNGVSLLLLGAHFLEVAEHGEIEGYQRGRVLSKEDVDRWDAYKSIGTVEECRGARDRQQAAKPIVSQGMPRCAMCHHVVDGGTHYCWWCGQKLEWKKSS